MTNKRKNKAAVSQFLDVDFGQLKTISGREINDLPDENTRSNSISDKINTKDTIVKELDPETCMPWRYADRPDIEMGDLQALALSMKKGQAEPILVRPKLNSNDNIQYEIIFGHRRWRAAKLAGILLKAIICELSDQEASLQQELENTERKDISDFSRAMYYQRLLKEKVYKNESQLAKSRGIARNTFNALMSYTRIPVDIIKAVESPHNISIRLAVKLASLCKNEQNIPIILRFANEISSGKITSANINSYLENYERQSHESKPSKRKKIVSKLNGIKALTLEEKKDGKVHLTLEEKLSKNINYDEFIKYIRSYFNENLK